MKSLLRLCFVGASIYAALLLSNPDPNLRAVTVQAQDTAPELSSWASDLRSLKPRIAAEKRAPLPYYERKPRPKLRAEEQAIATYAEAKSAVAPSPKPKVVKTTARKVKVRPARGRAERAVAPKREVMRNKWQRRAERRARKVFRNRAFLLGR